MGPLAWIIIIIIVILVLILLYGYTYQKTSSFITKRLLNPNNRIDLANPASVYCAMRGFTTFIRDTPNGQVGYCIFPDGSECDEWAYYRGQCLGPANAGLT